MGVILKFLISAFFLAFIAPFPSPAPNSNNSESVLCHGLWDWVVTAVIDKGVNSLLVNFSPQMKLKKNKKSTPSFEKEEELKGNKMQEGGSISKKRP